MSPIKCELLLFLDANISHNLITNVGKGVVASLRSWSLTLHVPLLCRLNKTAPRRI